MSKPTTTYEEFIADVNKRKNEKKERIIPPLTYEVTFKKIKERFKNKGKSGQSHRLFTKTEATRLSNMPAKQVGDVYYLMNRISRFVFLFENARIIGGEYKWDPALLLAAMSFLNELKDEISTRQDTNKSFTITDFNDRKWKV